MIAASGYKQAYKEFYDIFSLKLGEYIDSELTTATSLVFFDIIKFDEKMLEIWKYNEDEQSLQDVIIEHYGEKGNDLVKKLIEY